MADKSKDTSGRKRTILSDLKYVIKFNGGKGRQKNIFSKIILICIQI